MNNFISIPTMLLDAIGFIFLLFGFPAIGMCLMIAGLTFMWLPPIKTVMRLIAFLSNGRVVCLRDFNSEKRFSIAYIDDYGDMYCYWYWSTNTKFCLLLDDGKIHKGGYVEEWRYYKNSVVDQTKGWKTDGSTK